MKRLVGERGEWRVEVERLREVQRSRSKAVQEQCEWQCTVAGVGWCVGCGRGR